MSLMQQTMDAIIKASIFAVKVAIALVVAGVSVVVIIVKAANK